MWITKKSPVWSGNLHDFDANVIASEITTYDVVRILTAISNGDHIEELNGVFVIKDYNGTIQRIEVRKKPLTNQEKNP